MDLGVASRRVRVRADNLTELVTGSTENARRRLPERWQGSPVIDDIVEIVKEMAEMLRVAVAEPT